MYLKIPLRRKPDLPMKILFISLGCDKNLVDSEHMLGELAGLDYEITDEETDAEAIIINTCCFIDAAKEESIRTILDMAVYRREGSCRALIVTGCMAERYRQEVLDEIPEVDVIVGTNSWHRIREALEMAFSGERTQILDPLKGLPPERPRRVLTTVGHYAYLKIAEGCDKHCTYCVIPSIRGAFRSVPMEELVQEAETLAADGVQELILVAQETTRYGLDLYGEKQLHRLLEKLCGIEGIRWIRVLYCYPEEIYPALVDTMRDQPKICHYLDLPIQHASDPVLKRMNRRTNQADLRRIIAGLRKEIPDITLRTTLISGFPGETEEDHEELMRFVNEMEFDRLGVFAYSREEGTPAARMPGQIDEEVKLSRRDALLELQQEISADRGLSLQGRELEVLIEGEIDEPGVYVGRTRADAPDIDGYFFVQSGEPLHSGDFVKARVTGSLEYDLTGSYLGPSDGAKL